MPDETLPAEVIACAETAVVPVESDVEVSHKPLCQKCGFEVDIFRAVIKSKTSATNTCKFICRNCSCLSTMLSRNLQVSETSFKDLPLATQQEFWRNAGQQNSEDGQFRYSKVKALLTEILVRERISSSTARVFSEALPIGVWEQRGYPVESILANAECEDNPALGKCYKVPIKQHSREEVIAEVHRNIMNAEQRVSAKRKTASLADEERSETGKPMQCLIEIEDDDSEDEDSGDAPPAAKKGKSKSSKKRQSSASQPDRKLLQQQAAEEKRKERKLASDNAKICRQATRALMAVGPLLTDLESVLKGVDSRIPQISIDSCQNHVGLLKEIKREAEDRLAKQAKAATKNIPLDGLSIDAAEQQQRVRAAQADLQLIKKMVNILPAQR